MVDYYEMSPFNRQASIAVLPLDSYTGEPVTGKEVIVYERSAGMRALAKKDGHHVFIGLPSSNWEIHITCGEYFEEVVKAVAREGRFITVRAPLTPNANYKLRRGMTYLDCPCPPGTVIHALPIGLGGQFRLQWQREELICLRSAPDADFSGELMAFYNGGEPEIFRLGERRRKNVYEASLSSQYEPGAEIYPVSVGRSDASGRLLCPIRGFTEKHSHALAYVSGSGGSHCVTAELSYGRGCALKI